MAGDERFRRLNGRFRRVVAVGAAGFLGWYFVYVALAAFARGFMSRPVAGNVNIALLFGVLQFASTFLLAAAFAAYARRRLDPLADELRAEADGPPAAASERAFGRGTPPWAGGGAGPLCTPGAAPVASPGLVAPSESAASTGLGAGPSEGSSPIGDAPSVPVDGFAPPTSSGTSRPAPIAPRASDGRWDVRMGDAR